MRAHQRVLKNAVVGTGAGALAFLADLAIIATLARHLGVASFGTFAFVTTFVRAFRELGDLGLYSVLVRDIARRLDQGPRVLGTARGLVWILSGVTAALVLGAIHLTGRGDETIRLTYLAVVAMIALLHAEAYAAVCRAHEEMEFNALVHVGERALFLLLVLGCAALGRGLTWILASHAAASLAVWALYARIVRRRYGRCQLSLDPPAWWDMLREAAPVGFGVALRRVAWRIDTVFLGHLADRTAVGLFNAAYRMTGLLHQFSVTLSHPFVPVYARVAARPGDALGALWERSFKAMWVLALGLALVPAMFADRIVRALYGEPFAAAAQALVLQSAAVPFLFPASLFAGILTAIGQQRRYVLVTGASLVVNVGLDLALIPVWGFLGASLATVAAEITLFGVGLWVLRTQGLALSWGPTLTRPLAAALVAGGVAVQFRDTSFPMTLAGAAGTILLYGALLVLLRAVTVQDLATVRSLFPLRGWRARE